MTVHYVQSFLATEVDAVRLLLIENSVDAAEHIASSLQQDSSKPHSIHTERQLYRGVEVLHRERFDVVLLNPELPDSQGISTVRLFRSCGRDVPAVVLLRNQDECQAEEYLKAGAQDFVFAGELNTQSLLRSLRYARDRFCLQQQMTHQSLHDPLTGLPNRIYFDQQLERVIADDAYVDASFVVLFLDLDGFKQINDLGGHCAGDQILRDVATRLRGFVRKGDVLSRLCGDQFGVIVSGIEGRHQAEQVASRIHATMRDPFMVGGQNVVVSCSVGLVGCVEVENASVSEQRVELLRAADMAMHAAKAAGRGCTRYFDDEMRRSLVDRARLEQALHHAVSKGELRVYYQPIVELTTGRHAGLEALCRWIPEGQPPVSPVVFIPIAERTGLIQPIGRWVLQQACADFAKWKQDAVVDRTSTVSLHVNMSRVQLADPELVPTMVEAVRSNGLRPCELAVEVTESCIIEDDSLALRVFTKIKEQGFELCIDDFGVGYSSLGHLRRFPFDSMKIDRSFIAQLDDNTADAGVVLEAITTLATSLGLATVAEGIETDEQARQVMRLGSPLGQGFLYCRPAPIERLIHAAAEVTA